MGHLLCSDRVGLARRVGQALKGGDSTPLHTMDVEIKNYIQIITDLLSKIMFIEFSSFSNNNILL